MSLPRWLTTLLKIEWAFAAIAMLVAFHSLDGSWLLFAILVLAPDLSMLGYFAGPRIGAICYNAAHTLVVPLAIAAIGWLANHDLALQIAAIWGFHIAFDRALGYGLKLTSAFQDTHLGRIGKQ